jgi:hypothetical protein
MHIDEEIVQTELTRNLFNNAHLLIASICMINLMFFCGTFLMLDIRIAFNN